MSKKLTVYQLLTKGKWERPTDQSAVYTEIEPGKRWGIRVTLIRDYARVEAINGPRCSWYKAPKELSIDVRPPNFFEKIKRITFEQKLMAEVEAKRRVAAEKNGKAQIFKQTSETE